MFDPSPTVEHSPFFEPKFTQGLRQKEPVREGEASPDAPLVEETLEPRSRHWSRRSPQGGWGGWGLVLGKALPGQGEGTWAKRPFPCLPWSSVSVPRVKGTSARRHPRRGEGTWAKRPSPPPLELRFFSVQNLSPQKEAFAEIPTARKNASRKRTHLQGRGRIRNRPEDEAPSPAWAGTSERVDVRPRPPLRT